LWLNYDSAARPRSKMPSEFDNLNRAQLDQIRQLESFKPGVSAQLVAMFEANARNQLDSFRNAASVSDFDAMRRAAHSLKGVSASLGASGLSALAAQVEGEASRNEPASLEAVAKFEQATEASIRSLAAWLSEG